MADKNELIDVCTDLIRLVEGVGCKDWRDQDGNRFKDTNEWVRAYVAINNARKESREQAVHPADAALADVKEVVSLIVRDVCETDPANPDHPDSVCIDVDALIGILTHQITAAMRARAVPVDDICNAYESGVGHNGRPTANVNPYPPGTPQHTAYELGAKGTKHSAAAVPEGWSLAAHPDGGIVVQHRTLGGCFVTEEENHPREIPGQILFYLASDMLAASKEAP